MRARIFVDTGPFYARYVARDSHHEEACQLWKNVGKEQARCLTTNFILAELITLIVYRFGVQQALQTAHEIYTSHVIEVISVSREIELKALEWLEQFDDQKFSMTDAISFSFMKETGLKTALTFDHHFEIAGFERSYA